MATFGISSRCTGILTLQTLKPASSGPKNCAGREIRGSGRDAGKRRLDAVTCISRSFCDLLDYGTDFPGVGRASERGVWTSLSLIRTCWWHSAGDFQRRKPIASETLAARGHCWEELERLVPAAAKIVRDGAIPLRRYRSRHTWMCTTMCARGAQPSTLPCVLRRNSSRCSIRIRGILHTMCCATRTPASHRPAGTVAVIVRNRATCTHGFARARPPIEIIVGANIRDQVLYGRVGGSRTIDCLRGRYARGTACQLVRLAPEFTKVARRASGSGKSSVRPLAVAQHIVVQIPRIRIEQRELFRAARTTRGWLCPTTAHVYTSRYASTVSS